MSEYRVVIKTGAFAYLTVEADSEEEAEDIAIDRAPGICAQCSGWGEEYSLEIGDDWEIEEVQPAGDEADG